MQIVLTYGGYTAHVHKEVAGNTRFKTDYAYKMVNLTSPLAIVETITTFTRREGFACQLL